jgi:hypothetical protein
MTQYKQVGPTKNVNSGNWVLVITPCGKCGATGYINAFGHVHNGVCFDCAGARNIGRYQATPAHAIVLAERKAKRDAKAAAKAAKVRAKVIASTPHLIGLVFLAGVSDFAHSLVMQVLKGKTLSDLQLAGAFKAALFAIAKADRDAARLAEKAEQEAAKRPVVTGKIRVTGEVLTIKEQYSDYGSTMKMLVLDDRGFKVWGSVPRKAWDIVEGDMVGARLSFNASVEASNDDQCFGFFKRPSKVAAG